MWHEARRQEKAVRHKMVDNAKRHERRKQFYESVRRDPEEFMQLHGQKMPIHVDASIAEAAESPNTLRKWQGDPNVLIDRFDVRVHLEPIQEVPISRQAKKNILKDDVEELQCEYERYRILVFNEFRKIDEKSFLHQISTKEFWPVQQTSISALSTYRKEHEKKKKMADKRAAIAFNYGDSETVRGSINMGRKGQQNNDDESSTDEDEDYPEEPEEIDPVIDPDFLGAEQAAALNKIGTRFNIMSGVFLQLLSLDRKEQTSTAQIKEIDKAKLALSGRHAKADRAALKRRRAMIIGNLGSAVQNNEEATTTLLSFLANSNKSNFKEESTSSDSGEEFSKTEFITCFGGEDERNGKRNATANVDEDAEGDNSGIVHGPILPTMEYRRLLELSKRESTSPESQWAGRRQQRERTNGSNRGRNSSRSPVRRRRSRSNLRERDKRRSKEVYYYRRRSTSSSNSRSPPIKRTHHLETSSSFNKNIHSDWEKKKSDSQASSSNRDRRRWKSSRSRSPTTNPTSTNRLTQGMAEIQRVIGLEQQHLSVKSGYESSNSDSESSDSPLSVRSSMSDSEKERIERENRKRRIRQTKRMVREQQTRQSVEGLEEIESKAEKAAKKLRMQMHKALTKTAAQLKEEDEQRHREMIREKRQREEQLLEESRLLRQREREKRRVDEEQREHSKCACSHERNNSDNIKNKRDDKRIEGTIESKSECDDNDRNRQNRRRKPS